MNIIVVNVGIQFRAGGSHPWGWLLLPRIFQAYIENSTKVLEHVSPSEEPADFEA